MSKLTLSFKGNILRVYPVLKDSMLIGSDRACAIHIDSLALAPKHARIDTQANTSVLVDLDTESGTFVNNQRIKKHILADRDIIRVGKHILTFKFENLTNTSSDSTQQLEINDPALLAAIEEPAPTPTVQNKNRRGWLQIMTGQNMGKTLSLNRAMTNLGKPGVATAIITRRDDNYFLSHLEGEKTPLVRDKRIGDRSVQLDDGDIIQIGNIKMQFFLD
ncbi:MAG: FHA domain-containing protein [Proteobacteria bacterium]|nr:FHA domain-containing protein [Pseudomonadota bacterium]MCG6935502.1 FHA domain-containing protein [Pseudomonadota bacterium]